MTSIGPGAVNLGLVHHPHTDRVFLFFPRREEAGEAQSRADRARLVSKSSESLLRVCAHQLSS